MLKTKKGIRLLMPIISLAISVFFITGNRYTSADQKNSAKPSFEYQYPAFKFIKIVDDVYCAIGTESLPTWCNAVIIINDSDVVIIDTHVSRAAVRALLEELRTITKKPVRYVINTHYHFDHVFGNQAYPMPTPT
jgi:cyclase